MYDITVFDLYSFGRYYKMEKNKCLRNEAKQLVRDVKDLINPLVKNDPCLKDEVNQALLEINNRVSQLYSLTVESEKKLNKFNDQINKLSSQVSELKQQLDSKEKDLNATKTSKDNLFRLIKDTGRFQTVKGQKVLLIPTEAKDVVQFQKLTNSNELFAQVAQVSNKNSAVFDKGPDIKEGKPDKNKSDKNKSEKAHESVVTGTSEAVKQSNILNAQNKSTKNFENTQELSAKVDSINAKDKQKNKHNFAAENEQGETCKKYSDAFATLASIYGKKGKDIQDKVDLCVLFCQKLFQVDPFCAYNMLKKNDQLFEFVKQAVSQEQVADALKSRYLNDLLMLTPTSSVPVLIGSFMLGSEAVMLIPLERIMSTSQKDVGIKIGNIRQSLYRYNQLVLTPIANFLRMLTPFAGYAEMDETLFSVTKQHVSGEPSDKVPPDQMRQSSSSSIVSVITPTHHPEFFDLRICSYFFIGSRSKHEFSRVLPKGFNVIICDGCPLYDQFETSLQRCLVHCRRKFCEGLFSPEEKIAAAKDNEAYVQQRIEFFNKQAEDKNYDYLRAFTVLECLRVLHGVESYLKDKSIDEIIKYRKEISSKAVSILKDSLNDLKSLCKVVEKKDGSIEYKARQSYNRLHKAVAYALNIFEKEVPFLNDPLIPIHTNGAERSLRVVDLIRNASHQFFTVAGAMFFVDRLTISQTAKCNNVSYDEFLKEFMPAVSDHLYKAWFAKHPEAIGNGHSFKGRKDENAELLADFDVTPYIKQLIGDQFLPKELKICYRDISSPEMLAKLKERIIILKRKEIGEPDLAANLLGVTKEARKKVAKRYQKISDDCSSKLKQQEQVV